MNKAPERHGEGPGPSRRDFLRGSGVAAATGALTQAAPLALAEADKKEAGKTVAIGPGPVKLTLDVNGAKMTTNVEPRVTLLDTLRDYLDQTACKRVCERGTCGACPV